MEQLGSHRADFHEMCYLSIFRKYVVKIPVLLKSDKNIRYCKHADRCTFFVIQLSSFYIKSVSDRNYTENQNTHFMFNNFFENIAVYEIMCKNTVQLEGPQTAWRMSIACWIR